MQAGVFLRGRNGAAVFPEGDVAVNRFPKDYGKIALKDIKA